MFTASHVCPWSSQATTKCVMAIGHYPDAIETPLSSLGRWTLGPTSLAAPMCVLVVPIRASLMEISK